MPAPERITYETVYDSVCGRCGRIVDMRTALMVADRTLNYYLCRDCERLSPAAIASEEAFGVCVG